MDNKELAKIVAKAIFYSSIQASIGSVEMSSKFSVMNFSKDQETLQRAADALRSYMIIAVIWTIGTMLSLYASHGMCGALIGLLANLIMMTWIVVSYIKAFDEAAKKNNLKKPVLLSGKDWTAIWITSAVVGGVLVYLGGYADALFK